MKKIVFLSAFLALAAAACSPETESYSLEACPLTIGGISFTHSLNGAEALVSETDGVVTFAAQPHTDYFRDPDGTVLDNAAILFKEIDNTRPFTFQARLTPGFTEKGMYNAAALYVFSSPVLWQKFAFEQDERGLHRVVSVRTMDTSDDNNHQAIPDSTSLWYKISSDGQRMGFFYSLDGELWQMVRLYRNNYPEKVYLGISSQAPGEDACVSHFDKLSLSEGVVSSFRLGE